MQSCRHVDTHTHTLTYKTRCWGDSTYAIYVYTCADAKTGCAHFGFSCCCSPSSRGWTVSHLQPPRLIALCEVCGADRGWKALVLSLPVTGHVRSVRSCTAMAGGWRHGTLETGWTFKKSTRPSALGAHATLIPHRREKIPRRSMPNPPDVSMLSSLPRSPSCAGGRPNR